MFSQNFLTYSGRFLSVLLLIYLQDWKACFVSWSRIIEGLDFTYLCFIAPKKEEVWDFRTFSGIIGQPNFLLPPAGLY